MKKRTRLILALLVLLVAALLACYFAFAPKPAEGSKAIGVEVIHKDGGANSFSIVTEEEYLRGAMEQEGLIAGEESAYGLYVLTVDGETADEAQQEWWGYTKSGEYVEYGVDACPISDGDKYEFTLHTGW